MTYIVTILIKSVVAIFMGIILGNGAVYFFNKMPGSWLCDYGEKPSEELLHPTFQRIKSTPWKMAFTIVFVTMGLFLFREDMRYGIAVMIASWVLLEMSIADIKYMIIPDQMTVFLALISIGFIPFHYDWKESLYGGLIGFGIMLFIAIISKKMYKRDSIGGGDIKLFASLGLVTGSVGILIIFVLTTLISAGHFVWQLATKRAKKNDLKPMVPYIAISSVIYMVFLWQLGQILYL